MHLATQLHTANYLSTHNYIAPCLFMIANFKFSRTVTHKQLKKLAVYNHWTGMVEWNGEMNSYTALYMRRSIAYDTSLTDGRFIVLYSS